jgi:glycosyltransferase involved in cell wall biosynthesis
MPCFLILANLPASLTNFRGPLIEALLARGCAVHAAAPGMSQDRATTTWLHARGVVCHDVPLSRVGMNPLADLQTYRALTRLFRVLRPDVVLSYTIKPVIWGTLAAKAAGVPRRYALITGLGYAFTGAPRGKRWLIQRVTRGLYARALGHASGVFFQNPDDAALFRELDLVPTSVPITVVNGSGIDTAAFTPAPMPEMPIRFLLIARLLGDKGIREYVAAARKIRRTHPEIECHIVGGTDSNPDAIPEAEVRGWHAACDIVWHGALADVRPAIAAAHVFVLPSYREGTPRSVLEAMAMGRAIITTDAPGCRETVREGVNGFLVPVRDSGALAAAMLRFVEQPDLAQSMGAASREIAVERYDVHKVNAIMLREMGL